MTDTTNQGYVADPDDLAALADTVLADALDEPDLASRFVLLSKDLALYEALVEEIATERARTVAAMTSSGLSYRATAAVLNMSHGRVQQLVARARGTANG